MSQQQKQPMHAVALGGDAKNIHIAQIGYGSMHTWCDKPVTDGDILETLKAAIDGAAPHKLLFNGGAFYGPPHDAYANLRMIKNLFAKYPELRERVVLCIKGGFQMDKYIAKGMMGIVNDASEGNLREDLRRIHEQLGGDKPDIYELARVDKNIPIEEQMKTMAKLRDEGLFGHIGLSEVGADTIRRAVKVASVASVEVEFSMFETTIEENGVLAACEELAIPIFAYSVTGKGMLTGTLKKRSDLPPDDMRLHQDRFSEENFPLNVKLGEAVAARAAKRGQTGSQLAIGWAIAASKKRIIVPIPQTAKLARVEENYAPGRPGNEVTEEDQKEVQRLLKEIGVAGERYNAAAREHMNLWG